MTTFQVENLVKLYRKYASIPSPRGAFIQRGTTSEIVSLQSFWQVRNIEQSEKSVFAINYGVSPTSLKDNLTITQIGFPVELGSEGISAFSKSGLFRASIRKFTEKNGPKKQILEIWSTKSKLKTFDLQSFDVHGDICEDGCFGSLQWSADEKKLLYIAERKKPKYESFFSQKAKKSESTEDSSAKKPKQGIGNFVEEWGEQLVGRHNPAPFIFNINEETIESVEGIDDDISCGQAIWGPSDKGIFFIGWPNNPKRLGLIFCPIRPNKLYYYNSSSKEISIKYEDAKWCSSSPRMSHDEKSVVFLNNRVGGAHRHCERLLKYDTELDNVTVVLDIVHKPKDGEFPGLFVEKLPMRCWAPDNIHIIFASLWRSKEEITSINTKTGAVERLTKDDRFCDWTILDITDKVLIASRSSLNILPHIVLAPYEAVDGILKLGNWCSVEPLSNYIIPDIEWSLNKIQPENSKEEFMSYEVVIARPTDVVGKLPVIVVPHGGPHSTYSPTFLLSTHLYLKLGFALVLVNYRGSLGFGETQLESLLGKVGDQDVKDMQQAVIWALSKPWADSSKVIVSGGSHGGFLATHLIGQYPDFYKACICRNPVVNLAGKLEGSDIPDWGWTEVGLEDQYELCRLAPPDVLKVLWEKSPAQFIPKVKTPLLMLLGKDDLRVPPTQGLNYYYALKTLGKADVRLFMYEDNHSLSKVENECDNFLRIMLFVAEKLGFNDTGSME